MTTKEFAPLCHTGPVVAPFSAGGEAIPRSDTCSARAVSVSNTGKHPWNGLFYTICCLWKLFNHIVLFQLIQDEIKAMVQLQNRQASNQSHTEFSPNLAIKTCTSRKDCISPLFTSDSTGLKNPASKNALASPAHAVFSCHALPLQVSEPANQTEERATTGLSSGYGTLFARETSVDVAGSPREDEGDNQEREKQNRLRDVQQNRETTVEGNQQDCSKERTVRVEELNPLVYQQGNSGWVSVVYRRQEKIVLWTFC